MATSADARAAPEQDTASLTGPALETTPDDWPSVLAVLLNEVERSGSARVQCSATLIAATWALADARCVVDPETGLARSSDSFSLSSSITEQQNEQVADHDIGVTNIVPHPAFVVGEPGSDIALLELSQPVDRQRVALFDGTERTFSGHPVYRVGWAEAQNRPAVEEPGLVVQTATTASPATRASCRSAQSDPSPAEPTTDTAGAAVIIGIGGRQTLVGVVTESAGCAEDRVVTYTPVAAHLDWITEYVQVDAVKSREVSASAMTTREDESETDAPEEDEPSEDTPSTDTEENSEGDSGEDDEPSGDSALTDTQDDEDAAEDDSGDDSDISVCRFSASSPLCILFSALAGSLSESSFSSVSPTQSSSVAPFQSGVSATPASTTTTQTSSSTGLTN